MRGETQIAQRTFRSCKWCGFQLPKIRDLIFQRSYTAGIDVTFCWEDYLMAIKDPVDTKAAIFAVCAAVFIFAVAFASLYTTMR